ncbi:Duffy binding protein 1 [Plasmodium cynomolgi strain B]|uniref:Erythrocyte-binding protein n=2 Tax=Plasmodium cynomolgi TaxID=5827 RepID=K6UTY8_PLACD|nr:Duffy binding protein 1 [Plasmodium cynomolgi strain B]GAB65595.1 Duffy binding protein 1 [Plasmodium cynomolgi strain B]
MKGKNRPLFFLLVLLLSHKVNNVLLERTIETLQECKNECVKGENCYKLSKGHHYIEEDNIERWLQGTNERRSEENIKYKYGVTELKIKYEQMNGKRTSRILKESIYEAQNFRDNNYREEKDGEHKTDSKTDNGRSANNLVMLDYDTSSSGHPAVTLDNVLEFVTDHGENSLENSSNGGNLYDIVHKKTMSSGVINHAFLQNSEIVTCNDKRKRQVRDWDCSTKKDVCIPDRRYQLCMKEVTNLVNNTDTHFHGDITFRKLDFKRKLMYDAAIEGELLYKKNNYKYNKDLCRDIRWSLGDFGDIIMGTDMEGIGHSQVVENNLKSIFGTGKNALQNRVQWWHESKVHIWRAMMYSVRKRLKDRFAWICKINVAVNVEPQIYRWIREWGGDYITELPTERQKVKEKCDGNIIFTKKKVCTVSQCKNACNLYDQWITRKKEQWDVLSNKFKSVKNEQSIKTADIATAYDILKQEINKFNEETFENEINKLDNAYIDLCLCSLEEVKKHTQNVVRNIEKAAKSVAPNPNPINKAVDSSKAEKVQGNPENGNVNSGANNSTTGKAATGDGQNGNQTPTKSNVQQSDVAESAGAKNVDPHKSVSEKSADTTSVTSIAEAGKENLGTSNSQPSKSTVEANSPGDGTVNSASISVKNSEKPLVTTDKGLEPSKDNSDNNGSTESKKSEANPDSNSKGETGMGQDNDKEKATKDSSNSSDNTSSAKGDTTSAVDRNFNGGVPEDRDKIVGSKKEEKEDNSANKDAATVVGGNTNDRTENGMEKNNVPAPDSKQSVDATPLSKTESLELNESAHRITNDTTHSLKNENEGSEKDLQKHDFTNNDMPNEEPNSAQTTDAEGHHRYSMKNDNGEMRKHMNKGTFTKNPNSNQLNSHNDLSNGKLDIKEYKYRDVNATREKIIYMSEVRRCNNNISLNYCNSVKDKMSSNTCSREKSKNLCCSISDYCLNYFEVYTNEYHNCMKKEFEDPSYKCFTKGGFTDKAYFAAGGALLILLLLITSRHMIKNDSEEATFNEFEEHCDNIQRIPLMPNNIEHMQPLTPLDYS